MSGSIKRYGGELLTFGLVFIVVFSELRFVTTAGSTGNVEQWVNLTNTMFYGKQDFLFSYGPLFWLTGGVTSIHNVYTYWTSIAFISTVDAFFWAVLFSLSYRARSYPLLALAYFLFFSSLVLSSAFFLWPLAAVAYLEFSQPVPVRLRARSIVLLGIIVGFSCYVRFFYGTFAVVTFGSYYASRFLCERKIRDLLLLLAGTALGYIFVGILIFHNGSSVIDYFVINSQLNFGNSVDMTLDVDNPLRTFAAAAAVMLLVNIFVLLRKRSLFLTANALMVVLFKLGFSRADHYLAYFVIPAAVVACIMLFDGSRLGKVLFVLALGALYHISTHPGFPNAPTKDSLSAAVDFSIPYASRMKQTYAQFALPDSVVQRIGASAIDVYPYNNEYMFANELNYVHRPVFQNYMTLTPRLDAMNQTFFESSSRPQFLLWTAGIACPNDVCNPFDGFDQKMALNEDPLTSSAILLNYHFVDVFKTRNGLPAALLEANPVRTAYKETIISPLAMKFGEWYAVPQLPNGVVKLKPNLRFTVAGRLTNTLFRGRVLKVKYKLVSGEIREYRTNILNSQSGIWMSPLPENFGLEGPRVESVMLETRASNYFAPEFRGEWVMVPIETVRPARVQFDPFLQSPRVATAEATVDCDASFDAVNGVSPVPTQVNAAGALRVQGWLAGSAKDGVLPDKIFLTLTDPVGMTRYVGTRPQERPDVADAYKQPRLRGSGFQSVVDLSSLKGRYLLGMARLNDSRLYRCRQFQVPVHAN